MAMIQDMLKSPDTNSYQENTVSDKRPEYDQITFHVPKGQREIIKRLAKEKSGLSLSSHIKMLLERDLGIEIEMDAQVADNTGRRKTG